MHTNRNSPARKIIAWLTAAVGLFLLTGCDSVTLTDLTPKSMAENPSHIYTFSLRVSTSTNTVTNIVPRIVIDGQNHEMKRSPIGQGLYDFEYQLPAGRDKLAYYYLVNYNIEANNAITPAETYTKVETVQIVRRYVLSLEVNRGPVGSRISVLGRGFTPQDTINFNGTPARTSFESPNALSFFVPALEANRNYQVTVNSVAGNSPVGSFRIDPTNVNISPSALNLRTGERQMLSFTLANPAPPGGTMLDVTTDVPDSVIMPEVVIAQGETTVGVTVEGGKPGAGSLFLKGFGSGEVNVPVTVSAR
jgi:hypothetical protein